MFTHYWAVFKTMARSAIYEPYVFALRMTIDKEVSVGGVFVLADAHLHNRSVL